MGMVIGFDLISFYRVLIPLLTCWAHCASDARWERPRWACRCPARPPRRSGRTVSAQCTSRGGDRTARRVSRWPWWPRCYYHHRHRATLSASSSTWPAPTAQGWHWAASAPAIATTTTSALSPARSSHPYPYSHSQTARCCCRQSRWADFSTCWLRPMLFVVSLSISSALSQSTRSS